MLTATWTDLAIRLVVLGLLLYLAFTLIRPFITIAVWAVVLSTIGLRDAEFPKEGRIARGVMGLSAVLVVAAMTTAVVTA